MTVKPCSFRYSGTVCASFSGFLDAPTTATTLYLFKTSIGEMVIEGSGLLSRAAFSANSAAVIAQSPSRSRELRPEREEDDREEDVEHVQLVATDVRPFHLQLVQGRRRYHLDREEESHDGDNQSHYQEYPSHEFKSRCEAGSHRRQSHALHPLRSLFSPLLRELEVSVLYEVGSDPDSRKEREVGGVWEKRFENSRQLLLLSSPLNYLVG